MSDFNNTEKLTEQELNEVSGGTKFTKIMPLAKVVAGFRARQKERRKFSIVRATDDKVMKISDDKSVKQTLKKADDSNKPV